MKMKNGQKKGATKYLTKFDNNLFMKKYINLNMGKILLSPKNDNKILVNELINALKEDIITFKNGFKSNLNEYYINNKFYSFLCILSFIIWVSIILINITNSY